MDNKIYQTLKSNFLKKVANIPEKIRNEDIIAVIDDKAYTWNTATIEIRNDSPNGRKVLKLLHTLKLL